MELSHPFFYGYQQHSGVCKVDFANNSENYMRNRKCFILYDYKASRYNNNNSNNASNEKFLTQITDITFPCNVS
jgi:hypothetical protein